MEHIERKPPWEPDDLQRSDAELLRRAQDGDEDAYHEFVDRYAADLYRLACSLVGNAEDAEDVLQEAFIGAYRHAGRFQGRSSVRTWLISIVTRQAARYHRRRGRKGTLSLEAVEEEGGAFSGDPSGRVARPARVRMDVRAALEQLAPIHREAIVLRELQGLSYREMADVLGIPPGTVESRLFRARQAMRELLSDYLPDQVHRE